MKRRLILLHTRDKKFEELFMQAMLRIGGGVVLAARTVGEALQIVCAHPELDLGVIDFADGCHGMTLLSALDTCRPELPLVAVTSEDTYRAAAIAYANGVAACLSKPVLIDDLEMVLSQLGNRKLELVAA